MPELEKPDNPLVTTNVKWRFPSVHPEGRKFLLIAAVLTIVVYSGISHFVGWLLVGLTIWVAAFFRDPIRTTPEGANLIVAPADGLITMIAKVPPPRELAGAGMLEDAEMTRVSIFMSVFDVHINRSPVAGRVLKMAYVPGKFLNADLDKASEDNERQHFLIEAAGGYKIGVTQIAGLVARRILTFVQEGESVGAGQRIGLIRFGSRVDVYLPAGTGPLVLLGQRSIAGETVLADLGLDPKLKGTSQ
ncbi:phosphatidylserine decarboxylase [Sphingomonas sabuli]|uniref:Phosphatidylserine decarboxylase proenzyme n=1 Tax=Sphingomonas sabuli TaxID=2764186 RepID=A0A7G9L3M5_9SPHN|nr:phosphatidylserine decarboxylase [Sphingomonas sabuli]QNM83224.1 phosphatidylserine decarboxylase [Sphingomonas sabuli]